MADNVTLPVLTKDIGGFHAQKVLVIDGSGTIITSFGSGTQYAEDAASAGAEQLTLAGAIRRDTPSSGVNTDGDYANISVDANGRLYVTAIAAGDVAHDAADSGNPIKVGAKAKSALSGITQVAADDRTDLYADLDGALVVRGDNTTADLVSGNASNTDGSSTQCIAGVASVKIVLTDIILVNTHATDFAYVEIKDGAAVKLTIPVPPKGGAIVNLTKGIVGTTNTAWNFDPSAATTTIYCSMSGYKIKG